MIIKFFIIFHENRVTQITLLDVDAWYFDIPDTSFFTFLRMLGRVIRSNKMFYLKSL